MEEGKKKEGGGKGSGAFFYYAALAALPTEFHEAEEASRIGAGGGKGGEGRGGGDVSGFLEPRSNREAREASHLRRGGMGLEGKKDGSEASASQKCTGIRWRHCPFLQRSCY